TAISLTMSNSALAGLAVTAHNNALLNTSSFDSVTLNQPPTLAYISNYNLIAGALLVFTNSASDPDVPVQTITYNQINSPVGAALNPNTGVFNWRPAVAQSPSTQTVSVVVSDNGVPAMSATQNFSIVVSQPAPPVLGSASNTNGQFGFWVNGDVGPDYFIQVSTNLANWSALATVSAPVPPFFLMDPNSTNYSARFYRALLGP
ncbi:MAG: putative Ig domain-containing protein, partial [Verrucomicrobiota bacterium]